MSGLSHVSIGVNDVQRAKAFYDPLMNILGLDVRQSDEESVDRFYREALRLGGRDAGAPGLRPQYSATYYGAFVLNPDGNKIEAVTDND
jgi:catechol 2,3-dioxygenase-like lactoylglutathione lyase family enzyme